MPLSYEEVLFMKNKIKNGFNDIRRLIIILFNTFMNSMFILVTIIGLLQGEQVFECNNQIGPCVIMVLIINAIYHINNKIILSKKTNNDKN